MHGGMRITDRHITCMLRLCKDIGKDDMFNAFVDAVKTLVTKRFSARPKLSKDKKTTYKICGLPGPTAGKILGGMRKVILPRLFGTGSVFATNIKKWESEKAAVDKQEVSNDGFRTIPVLVTYLFLQWDGKLYDRLDKMWELWTVIDAVAQHCPDEDAALFLKVPEGSTSSCFQMMLWAHARLFTITFSFDRGGGRCCSFTTYMHKYLCHLCDQLKAMRIKSLLFANAQGLEGRQKGVKRGLHETTGGADCVLQTVTKIKRRRLARSLFPIPKDESKVRCVALQRGSHRTNDLLASARPPTTRLTMPSSPVSCLLAPHPSSPVFQQEGRVRRQHVFAPAPVGGHHRHF